MVSGEAREGLRLPPHSVEAEQSVLGGLMLDAAAWDQVADRVVAADFYRNDHRLIFDAIAGLIERNQPCDAVTLSGHLEILGVAEQVGGLSYLGALARDTPSAANIRAYADIVRERSVLRQLITAGNGIVTAALEPEGREAREIVDEAERAVFEIAERGSRGKVGLVSVKSILPDVVNQIDEMYHSEGKMRGVATGFKLLDEMTSGLNAGDLIIIAGRPSMGKTTFAVNIAENAALGAGKSAAIFSMEMSAESLTMRMISSLGRINQGNLRSGRLSEDDWPRIDSAMTQLSAAKIYIDETPALTPTEVRARARRLKRERGLDLMVVDYLQLMQVAGNTENRATEVSEISRSMKALAKELKIPVIALSQLNRGVEQRENKKPVMSDLRECVTGETLIMLADGRRVPIRDLVGQTPEVWAMRKDQTIEKARSDRIWSKGLRPVFRVVLASGRMLRATSNHRVFTGEGWRVVGALGLGSRVAVARRFPMLDKPVEWNDEQIAQLGRRSLPTHLPSDVFQFSDARIGLLLKHLWASDGCTHGPSDDERGGAKTYFCFRSEQLARDVAALLMRLGIIARLSQIRQRVGKPVWDVRISGSEQQHLFLSKVVALTRSNLSIDILPQERVAEVGASMQAPGSTLSQFTASRGTHEARGDFLFWDRVVAVVLEGEEEVFDITVPGPASWLADGIVSHNSGSLEQDADLILLIYREDFYDQNTTRKGIADIIIAKQRNGPTGEIPLTFLGQYTKFENFAPDSYGEGVFHHG